jgi:hypothetical protein
MKKPKLKPCPFCGGQAKLEKFAGQRYDTLYAPITICGAALTGDHMKEHQTDPQKMTEIERAKGVLLEYLKTHSGNPLCVEFTPVITAAIQLASDAAREEGVREGLRSNPEICPTCRYFSPRKTDGHLCPHLKAAYESGFSDCREMAAKVADNVSDPDEGYQITKYAEEIRALKPGRKE